MALRAFRPAITKTAGARESCAQRVFAEKTRGAKHPDSLAQIQIL